MAIEFKRIAPGVFRELQEDECRILFMRHGDHKDNILTNLAVRLLTEQGGALKAAGIVISGTASSPADRAVAAAYFTKFGLGTAGRTETLDQLGDLSSENPELIQKLKTGAKDAGVPIEQFCFDLCRVDDKWCHLMHARGEEGARALYALAFSFPRQTVLATSHGGARMEIVIAVLKGTQAFENALNNGPEAFIAPGQIVELILRVSSSELVEVNYFEPPTVNQGDQQL